MAIRNNRWTISFIASLTFLLAAILIGISTGSAGIPLSKLLSSVLSNRESMELSIIVDIRLPRIALSVAIGGALSVAGVILQGMFRNPLVEPYTLGISGGAALGVSLCLVFGMAQALSGIFLPLSGFIGALAAIMPIYILSARKGVLKLNGLLLTGVMVSFISSSLVTLILAVSRTEDLQAIVFWIMGSLQETNWVLISVILLVAVVSLFVVYFFSLNMNAMALGEDEAAHLGINVNRTKAVLFFIASLLAGISVSITGIIGFVGLVVPHFMRLFVGYDHRILLATSFFVGGGFLIFCDTLARTILTPVELPVGVITGIIGGILFVYAMARKQFFRQPSE